MRNFWFFLAGLLCLVDVEVYARERGMANEQAVFVEKGTRSAGLSMGWNSWKSVGEDGADLIGLATGLKGSVNILDISCTGSWFVGDNRSLGLIIGYSNMQLDVDTTQLLGNDISDRHIMRQILNGSVTCRQYLPLFDGRVAALFFEGRLTGQIGFYKNYDHTSNGKEGIYNGLGGVKLGLYPGVSVFATDRVSFEISMPFLEGGYRSDNESSTDSSDASIKHGFVRFKPSFTGIKMGLIYHF